MFLAKVKEQAEKVGPGRWITGRGWIETFWKPPVFPTREELDKVAPDNPVFLERADGHGAVANSKALKIAGIDAKTPNPFGGEILRDKKTGEPTRHVARQRDGVGREENPAAHTGGKRESAFAWRATHARSRLVRDPKRREPSAGGGADEKNFTVKGN